MRARSWVIMMLAAASAACTDQGAPVATQPVRPPVVRDEATLTPPTAHFTMTDYVGGLQDDGTSDETSATDGGTLVVQPGDPVDFDASPSTQGDAVITDYDWDIDGGDAQSGETTTYYFEPGDYGVDLTVTDANDLTGMAYGEVDAVAQDTTEAGGGGGDRDCWDVYLVETDDEGTIIDSWYEYTYCCDESGCQLS